jgi:hypothetical protein
MKTPLKYCRRVALFPQHQTLRQYMRIDKVTKVGIITTFTGNRFKSDDEE